MEEELAARRDLVADQQVEVTEPSREEHSHQGVVELDPGRPGPARLRPDRTPGVAFAGRVVELVLLGPDHYIGARPFAEVDPGMGRVDGRRASDGRRWEVTDE